MVYLLAGILSQTLNYPRFTHAFAGLTVILTSVGDAFSVYLRDWELNGYSQPTSSIKLSDHKRVEFPHLRAALHPNM